jgi:hypothetical protein
MTETKKPKMRDGVIKRGAWWYYVTRDWDPQLGRKKPVWHGKHRLREERSRPTERRWAPSTQAPTFVRRSRPSASS